MNYRHFSKDQETLAREWASTATTSDAWVSGPRYSDSESKPFIAERADGFRGIAKPGEPKGENDAHAAHEKIASDLAYHLELPIAPAVLWDRGEGYPTRYVSISAWAFASCDTWNRLSGTLTQEQKDEIAPVFSAIAVFETWITAWDRKKGDSVLIDSNSTSPVGLAFCDYADSMSGYWHSPNSVNGKALSFFPDGISRQEVAGRHMADKIASFDHALIEDIVGRIPIVYINRLKKNNITANLKTRSSVLHHIMGL